MCRRQQSLPTKFLAKVESTAVNHLELVEASGWLKQVLPIDLPWTPGHEFSGVVEQIGSNVAAFATEVAAFTMSLAVSFG